MQRWLRFEEALQFERQKLNEIVEKAKKINTDYQVYLRDNPYREDRNKLVKKRREVTEKILTLIDTGHEKYKP